MNNLLHTIKRAAVAGARLLAGTRAGHRPPGCGNILTTLLHLCDMDEAMQLWVLRWMAFQLRHPGAKMATAVVVNGKQFGKSLFFADVLEPLFGSQSRRIMAHHLHDANTSWAFPPARLIVVHGVFSARCAARMRALITSQSVLVDRRAGALEQVANGLNFVFLSSASEFLPDAVGARRFAIIEAPPAWPRSYYEAVLDEIRSGGIDAFRDYLVHHLDMGTFNESTQPPQPRVGRRWEAA